MKPPIKELRDAAGQMLRSQEWKDRKALYGNRCACCAKPESEVKLQLDHIVPVSKDGTNEIENTQPLCRTCNLKKRVKIIVYPFDILACTTQLMVN
jgi:5-methylcytosine-specific restriction endonuclease McrA